MPQLYGKQFQRVSLRSACPPALIDNFTKILKYNYDNYETAN